jgi:hypothetical protein
LYGLFRNPIRYRDSSHAVVDLTVRPPILIHAKAGEMAASSGQRMMREKAATHASTAIPASRKARYILKRVFILKSLHAASANAIASLVDTRNQIK